MSDPLRTSWIVLIPLFIALAACGEHERAAVRDDARLLSISEVKRLKHMVTAYEKETSHQFAVLTVATLNGHTIEDFAFRALNDLELGVRGVNNAVLVVVAVKERQVRIELGLGFERYISNEEAGDIIRKEFKPAFAAGNFAEGLEKGLHRLMEHGRRFKVNANTKTYQRAPAVSELVVRGLRATDNESS